MSRRDPHEVLGVPLDASQATIKAAWRRLAREHHPDLAAGDPAAARRATRRMAEINAAYESLRAGSGATGADRAPRDGTERGAGRAGFAGGAGAGEQVRRPRPPADGHIRTKSHSPGGPPRPRPGRPVTARVDMSDAFRPRSGPDGARGGGRPAGAAGTPGRGGLRGAVAGPPWRVGPEPLRASEPNGPLERSRSRGFRPPPPPSLQEALEMRMAFGKFHGHTLGEIAGFEPSYLDWVASTITRDRELVAAARVIRDDLDARGIRRVRRAERIAEPPLD